MAASRICLGLAILGLYVISLSASADEVVVLTDQNFDKEVGQDRAALVEFYAPWYSQSPLFSTYIHTDCCIYCCSDRFQLSGSVIRLVDFLFLDE